MKRRIMIFVALALLSAFALASCSTAARAERKGKQAGAQICDAKDADNADEADRHIQRAKDKLNDLARFTGRNVQDDLRDIDRNLDQLARGGASSQDVNAIVRSAQEAKANLSGNAEAAIDGLLQGLAECD